MRACENMYGVGDSVGMCRFTTKLFNSPSLPGLEEFAAQIQNVTGLTFAVDELDRVGQNIMGVERMINARLGVTPRRRHAAGSLVRRADPVGSYKGRRSIAASSTRCSRVSTQVSNLTPDGVPVDARGGEELQAR